MPGLTERERNEILREKVRQRLSRTLMRRPDSVDLLHLGRLLHEVWQEGYEAGQHDHTRTGVLMRWPTVNPFSY
jgi:hypothetical protein